ncbi:MAG: hypothetical protein NT154_05510 [Verrucomicrobia bacterium]|nr:hypothetical protein [Verrucomicrobiota bacterium]
MKRNLLLLSAGLFMMSAFAGDPASSPVFQMRVVAAAAPEAPPPGDYEKLNFLDTFRAGGQTNQQVLYVEKKVLLDQNDIQSAKVVLSQPAGQSSSHPEIAITFSDTGRKRMAEVTRQNIGKRLAIIIDGQVYSAPVIRSEISGGKATISGSFDRQEADNLCKKISQAIKK